MSHTPLGEVCLTLGLMRTEDVERILASLREGGRARFGEIAIELGLLDDEGLARALAHQFRLNMVPPERLARLSIAPDVLDLVPYGLIRERLLLPTFLDDEKRVLSLLTADPTDIPSLRAAQTAARAARLRLFVAPRSAMRELIDRLLPEDTSDRAPTERTAPEVPGESGVAGMTVVFEPDPERASALRRLEAAEGGTAEIVGDPEQVSAFIEANQADRVFFRRAVLAQVEPYLPSWRRLRPTVQICALDGFGPGRRIGIPYERTRDFFFGLLGHLLVDADGPSGTGRRTSELARSMAEHAGLPVEQRDTVALAALFTALGDAPERGTTDEASGIRWAADLLRVWSSPYDVQSLFDALLPRVRGEAGPGGHVGAEMLFTARAAVRAHLGPGDDPVAALGSDAPRHAGIALQALAAVLRRQGLREQVQAAEGEAGAVVVLANLAAPLADAARAELSAEGYTVANAADAPEALRLAHSLRAGALVTDVASEGGSEVEAALREDGSIPVVRLQAPGSAGEGTALPALLGALRKVLRRRPESPAAVTGRLSDLPLVDLLQTLMHGGRTARIVVVGTADLGAVQVRDGRLVAATHGSRVGEPALHTLVAGREGRFEVRFEDAGLTNLLGNNEFLLLEALRRRDEQRA